MVADIISVSRRRKELCLYCYIHGPRWGTDETGLPLGPVRSLDPEVDPDRPGPLLKGKDWCGNHGLTGS